GRLPLADLADRERRDHRPRRAGSRPRDERRDARRVHARGPHRAGGPARRPHTRAGHHRLLRVGAGMSWVNAVVHGILLGGVYALLATGLSLMFGVMRIINLAHGSLALVGAYMAFLLVRHTS